MTRTVAIAAVGARTPVGLHAEAAAAAVRSGAARLEEHPLLVDAVGAPLVGGWDGGLDPEWMGRRRMLALLTSVLNEIADKLLRRISLDRPVKVLLALPERRPGFTDQDAAWVLHGASAHAIADVPPLSVDEAPAGHAGPLAAIGAATEVILRGQEPLVLICGAESYAEPDTLRWLESERRVLRDGIRAGFPPGEGAGAVVLSNTELLHRMGEAPLARVLGAGQAIEPRPRDHALGMMGGGLGQALTAACGHLQLPEQAAGSILCDINGERWRAEDWAFAMLKDCRMVQDPTQYTSAVDCWGDQGAASGALGCVLAAQAWQRGYAEDPRALVWGASDGGLRAAVVLEKGGNDG
ncbi:MAG: hypothetical protein H6739_17700 [Alphaproteobacteria bacterium]|nr:hypothetical protein [Alphaproteobacteria bacterium]